MFKIFPRQIIYQKNLIKIFIYSLFPKKVSKENFAVLEKKLNLSDNVKITTTSKARVGIYHILCYLLSKYNKKKVLMSPYTIYDLVNKVIQSGSFPVFLDNESETSFDISIDDLKKKIDTNCSAIILTHHSINQSNLEQIAEICQKYNVKIIQDQAISFPSKLNNKFLYNYFDYSVCSFNLFKFCSSIFGGLIFYKDYNFYAFYKDKEKSFSLYNSFDLFKYFIKGIKFKILTNTYVFNLLTFKIIKLGYLYNIKMIKNSLKNDPNPVIEKNIPNKDLKSLNDVQIKVIIKSLDNLNSHRKIRENNYLTYHYNINSIYVSKQKINNLLINENSFINFPIFIKDKYDFSKFLFNNMIDHSIFYYRNLNDLEIFKDFKTKTPNLDSLEKNLIFLPTHHKINNKAILNICKIINNYSPPK